MSDSAETPSSSNNNFSTLSESSSDNSESPSPPSKSPPSPSPSPSPSTKSPPSPSPPSKSPLSLSDNSESPSPPSPPTQTPPPPSSDNSESTSPPSPPTHTPPPSEQPQAPPPQSPPPSPSPQSPPPSPPPQSPPPSRPPKSPPPSPPSKSPSPSPPPQSPPPSPPSKSPPPSAPPQSPPPTPPPQSPPPTPPPPTPPPQTPAPSSNSSPPPTGQNHAPTPSSTPNGNGNENGGGNTPPPPAVSSPPPPAETGKPPSGSQSPPNAEVAPSPLRNGGDSSSKDSRLAAPTASPTETNSHTTGNNNKNSESAVSKNQEAIKIGTGVAVAGVVIIVIITVIFIVIKGRKKKQTNGYAANREDYLYGKQGGMQGYHSSGGNGSQGGNVYHGAFMEPTGFVNSQVAFTYEQMMEMTNKFSKQQVIGGGGFGSVYQGFLPDGRAVAVKQLKAGSGQGEREFRAEVEIISRVHHRHLVALVGYCIYQEQRLLIYEFVPNYTLEHHLHGNGMPVLEWSKRLKIAIGSAKGLSYLHEDCHPKIIHRDIKSANILIDEAFEAKVADFGLAKLTNDAHTHVSTRVMGTFGYMAPEYASSGKLTDKSDVFSFGVVLLELVTGRKPVDPSQPLGEESLVEWARPFLMNAIGTRNISELVDPRLKNNYVEDEMFRMIESAAACIRRSAPNRPRIVQVMRALDSEAAANDLSNGFKYGQSTIYDSSQYNQDIQRFQQMVDGSFSFDMHSAQYISSDSSQRQ